MEVSGIGVLVGDVGAGGGGEGERKAVDEVETWPPPSYEIEDCVKN